LPDWSDRPRRVALCLLASTSAFGPPFVGWLRRRAGARPDGRSGRSNTSWRRCVDALAAVMPVAARGALLSRGGRHARGDAAPGHVSAWRRHAGMLCSPGVGPWRELRGGDRPRRAGPRAARSRLPPARARGCARALPSRSSSTRPGMAASPAGESGREALADPGWRCATRVGRLSSTAYPRGADPLRLHQRSAPSCARRCAISNNEREQAPIAPRHGARQRLGAAFRSVGHAARFRSVLRLGSDPSRSASSSNPPAARPSARRAGVVAARLCRVQAGRRFPRRKSPPGQPGRND